MTGLTTLSFDAYFRETVNESRLENFRVRRCKIVYYLEDNSLQIDELRTENSGMAQGSFVKRHRIPRNSSSSSNSSTTSAEGFLGPEDFVIGQTVLIYGRRFQITDANESTKQWLERELGRPRVDPIPVPVGE